MKIIKSVFIVLFAVFIQETPFSQGEINFYKKAVKIKTISSPGEILIGSISSLDADKKGRLLITDIIGKAVYLFDNKGKLLQTLSAEKCNPGFTWQPFDAKFNKEGKIILLNSLPWGFRFDENGKCIGGMVASFIASPNLAFLKGGNMIGYYNHTPNGKHYLQVMNDSGKEKFKFGKFPEEYKNIIYRFEGGGLATDDNDNIYQLNVSSPEIFKYDKKGKFLKSFINTPSYFRKIERDLSGTDPAQNLKEISIVLEKTTAVDLFMFEPGKLMVQLYHNKFHGLLLSDLEGKNLLKEGIIVDKKFYAQRTD